MSDRSARTWSSRASRAPLATLRGRLTGLQISVVTGGPRLGDLEAGAVATTLADAASAVSGGLACAANALLILALLPGFRRQRSDGAADQITLQQGGLADIRDERHHGDLSRDHADAVGIIRPHEGREPPQAPGRG
ncbi:hypothetical protein; Putative integral membrane transport protein [Frankia alni ACN14a]|uniref:Uncharacterized protein n=1 Tax=Frankia alni (strain DSM 45986 / CECT 9034 / ACN14a) TaxID=326424 RepID=Q0RL94_FRAAA|nr:hypothetical protein [Frankia sp. AvcI1]CAJ61711.1 hypothetical protein; Putative integral membrane transport protein [Frankia alni ACN14a]